MKAITAIRKFIGDVSVKEIKEFKGVCALDEWQEFGKQACELLDEEFESIN